MMGVRKQYLKKGPGNKQEHDICNEGWRRGQGWSLHEILGPGVFLGPGILMLFSDASCVQRCLPRLFVCVFISLQTLEVNMGDAHHGGEARDVVMHTMEERPEM